MNKIERIENLLRNHKADRLGFWKGNPHQGFIEKYSNIFGDKTSIVELSDFFNDDFVWLAAERYSWKPKKDIPMFDPLGGRKQVSLSQDGCLSECENVNEVDRLPWPNIENLNFDDYIEEIDVAKEKGLSVFGGFWAPFFHIVSDYFGMENYFIKMFSDEEIVLRATEKIVQFYLEANELLFKKAGNKIDAYFFGNDFGSQIDLLVGPNQFKKFILPFFKRFVDLAHRYDIPVVLHSCGAIDKAIPYLIDAGIDALHPLQAKAQNMHAENLAKYKNDIVFIGGIDTQELLPHGKPDDIKREIDRISKILGDGFIVSPSHEALLSDVPIENVMAMKEAVLGK